MFLFLLHLIFFHKLFSHQHSINLVPNYNSISSINYNSNSTRKRTQSLQGPDILQDSTYRITPPVSIEYVDENMIHIYYDETFLKTCWKNRGPYDVSTHFI